MSAAEATDGWAEASEIPNPDGPRGDLPFITLPSGKVTITDTAEKLFPLLAASEKYFVRGGRVMKLNPGDDGHLALEVLDHEGARSDFEKFAQLFVWRAAANGGCALKPTVCTAETAKALLASEEAQQILPTVSGLINCPIIYEKDGGLAVAGPGYDSHTQMLVTGGATPETVDLDAAVSALRDLVAEFDFQSDGDKARAIASFLAPALKLGGFLKGRVPADVAEADQSQSGKTYRQKAVAAVYNEQVSLVTHKEGGVGSVDESLCQQLVAGRPFIQFDNFRGRLSSPHLEAFLTAEGSFPCRIPHKGEIKVKPENFFICLTSNGVDTTRDFANRSSIIRIKKKPARFAFRKYEEGDLLAHVRARQAFYLGCVFAVIRAWHENGKLRSDETRHDFREWVQILDWIAQNILKLNPLMEGHQQAQERVSNPDMTFLRAVAVALERMNELGKPLSATDIQCLCETESISIPGVREFADADRAVKVIGTCMGRLFRQGETVDVEGYRVERKVTQTRRPNGEGYFPTKTYTLTRACAKPVKEEAERTHVPNDGESRFAVAEHRVAPLFFTLPPEGVSSVCDSVDLPQMPEIAVGSENNPKEQGKV